MNTNTIITNEITLNFFEEKEKELTRNGSIDSILKIDAFLNTELEKISEELKRRLILRRNQELKSIETKINEVKNNNNMLQEKIKDYEQDFDLLETLKGMKRKSTPFNPFKK